MGPLLSLRHGYDGFLPGSLPRATLTTFLWVRYLFNHLGSVGVSGRIPFLGGGSMRAGVSYHNGEWDAGVIMEGSRIEIGYDTGNFDTQRGNLNTRVDVGVGKGGASVSWDTKTGEFSGASIGVGPQLGVSVGGSNTNTISVRQVYREIVAPVVDKVKQFFSKPGQ
jgi:hypothetical protein